MTLSFTIFSGQKNYNRAHMLFQVLCGFEPIFYTTHPNEESVKSRFLRYCGSNSLIIFATHGNLIYLFRKYISTNMHGYISGIGLMILIMLMEVPLIYIIHNYIPWIMGVQKQRK